MKRYSGIVVLLVGVMIAVNLAPAVNPLNVSNSNPFKMQVDKKVWNGGEWVDEITANSGDIVRFRISVYHPPQDSTESISIYDITVTDELPSGMTYVAGSTKIYGENVSINCSYTEPAISGNNLTWDLWNDSNTVLIGEDGYLYIEFNVTVSGYGTFTNRVNVSAWHCSEEYVYGEAIANVTVSPPQPGIEIEKWVSLDGENWTTEGIEEYLPHVIYNGNKIYFKINVTNTGESDLSGVLEDFLPSFLVYNRGSSKPIKPIHESDNYINWSVKLSAGESIEIIFNATPISGGEGENLARVTTDQGLNASDNVSIILYEPSIDVDKKVRKICGGEEWSETVEVSRGIVEFKIDITYHGNPLDPLEYVFHNITIVDELPPILAYMDNSTRFEGDWNNWDEYYTRKLEPSISGNTLTWYLDDIFRIPDGGTLTLYFKAKVLEDSGCGKYENVATVEGDECSGIHLHANDNATIKVPCPDVEIEKKIKDPGTGEWVDRALVYYGREIIFNITLKNVGRGYVENITVTDPLIEELNFIEASPQPDEINDNTLIWRGINLSAGEEYYIEFTVRFTGENCEGCYKNTANLTYHISSQELVRNDSAQFCIRNDGYSPKSYINKIEPYWHNGVFTVTAYAEDNETYVARVDLYYSYSTDNENWSEWQLYGSDTSGDDGWSWEFSGEDGYYRFCSIAYDAVGNEEKKDLAPEVEAGIDTVPPTSYVNSISPYEQTETPIALSYNASDDRSGIKEVKLYYRYSPDNETWTEWTEGSWSFDAPNGTGYYEFYSIAIDNAGNVETPPTEPDAICNLTSLEGLKINITRPVAGGIYFMNKKVFTLPINLTIVIGRITISAEVDNAYGDIDVEFIIDNESKFVDYTKPFNYTWNERSFLWHTIKVVAHDHYNDKVRTASAVRKILIFNFALTGKTGIEGKVYDNSSWFKWGIGGAKVTVYDHETSNEVANITTGTFLWSKGKFEIELNPGTYDLKVEAEGYKTKIIEGIQVNASEEKELCIPMDPIDNNSNESLTEPQRLAENSLEI